MAHDGGWIPFDARNFAQQALTVAHQSAVHVFAAGASTLPETALLYDLELAATGALLNRIWQQAGSCVGASGARAYMQSACGDAVRGSAESIYDICPWPTWGIGRRYAGMTRRGGGSFGAAQARACAQWGLLRADDSRLPQPKIKDGWLVWSEKIELDFSAVQYWPVGESVLAPDAGNAQVTYTAAINTTDELAAAIANGYGCTVASSFGTRATVRGGYLVGEWNDTWYHQMSIAGYHTHAGNAGLPKCRLWAVDNQWGAAYHTCPALQQRGVSGSFWVTEQTMRKILAHKHTEVYAHGNTEDFPARKIDWQNVGFV